jgi:hypothetical protein
MKKEGVGVMIYPNGTTYEGVFKNDISNGQGRIVHPNGDIYEGEFLEGKANGFGIFKSIATGMTYRGRW